VQIVASWQLWAAAPETATLIVCAWPCSAILHSCLAAVGSSKQATVPRTGWSWNSSKRAAKAAFMSRTLSTIDLVSKVPAALVGQVPVDSFHGRARDRGNHPLPALRRADGGHHADRRVCSVLGVPRLPGARDAEARRLLCLLLLRDGSLPTETGIGARSGKQIRLISRRVALALGLAPEAFYPFLPDDGYHRQRGSGIGPPPAERRVESYPCHRDHRQIGAE
jgi:hypothetical protein